MAPSVPDKIPCTTEAEFASQLRELQPTLNLVESEDSWEKIGRALQTLTALARGGAYKLDPDFVNALKTNYKPITGGMTTERTRLSGVALDLVSTCAKTLGTRFEPLVPLFIPALLKVLERPNKVFVTRGQTCLLLIVERCHLPSLVPFLREAVKEKSQSLRLCAAEATVLLVEVFDKSLLDVREGATTLGNRRRGNVEDIESIIKETARDANPGVRQVSRTLYEKYAELWPERLDMFLSPLTPTIKRYLNIKSGSSKPTLKAAAPLKIRPIQQSHPEPAAPPPLPVGPSRPVRSKAPIAAISSEVEAGPSNASSWAETRRHDEPKTYPTLGSAAVFRPPARANRAVTAPTRPVKADPRTADEPFREARSASRAGYRSETPSGASVASSSSMVSGPSRPPSRAQTAEVPHASGRATPTSSQPHRRNPVVPTRPDPLSHAASAPAELMPKPTSSAFVRVQRPKQEAAPPSRHLRAADGPVRAITSRDPPVRPMKKVPKVEKEVAAPVVATETVQNRPPLAQATSKPSFARPPTPPAPPKSAPPLLEAFPSPKLLYESPPAPQELSKSMPPPSPAVDEDSLPSAGPKEISMMPSPGLVTPVSSRPSSAMSRASTTTSQVAAPTPTRKRGVLPPSTTTAQAAPKAKQDVLPTVSLPTPPDLVTPATSRPVSVLSNAAATSSGTKRPAVLQRRAAVAPAGQVQGFAPTRRRPGVTEPTISQLAKQKPTQTFVPAVKRPDPFAPPASKKPAPSNAPVAAKKEGPTLKSKASSAMLKVKPAPAAVKATKTSAPPPVQKVRPPAGDLPAEVVTAMKVALPPITPDEVPLPPDELSAPSVSGTDDEEDEDMTIEATPRPVRRVSGRLEPAVERLVDFGDPTIVLPRQDPSTRRISTNPSASDLMDFDMSVILPVDDFAPMTAQPFAVLRDTSVEAGSDAGHHAASTPMTYRAKSKDLGVEAEERLALSELEMNLIFTP